MTRIHATRAVHCPFSATIEKIALLHKSDGEHHVGPFSSIRSRVQIQFEEVRDYTDETIRHEALEIRWKAPARMPLPVMGGLITVRPNGLTTDLRMEGTYVPPFGALGQLFDRIIGCHIAQRTVNRFLDDLRDFAEQEWQKERREHATAERH